uniref:Cytochrome c biogenesis FN n=1 Tax=Silene noctiflora TaxID=39899 RepID=G8E8S1_9CARY|nr:cytochrome c biogenesis FN [Silene noctiflora]
MSIFEFFHYSFFMALFISFTYKKKEPPAFGASSGFFCMNLSFFGLLFSHISNNLSNSKVLSANAAFFYQISGTWSNHEGSLLLWCRILTLYVFLLCYRGGCQSSLKSRSKRVGPRESLLFCFVLNFVDSSTLARYADSLSERQLSTPLVQRTLSASSPFSVSPASQKFPLLSSRHSHGSLEVKRTDPFFYLIRADQARSFSLDKEGLSLALGIAFFFFPFLSASSDPFLRNFFLCTEPLAESNPVLQDPISAIHPPCLYAGAVASAIVFVLAISKMMTGIVALYSPTMRKDAASKTVSLLCSALCLGSRLRSDFFPSLKFQAGGRPCSPPFFFRRQIELGPSFLAFSSFSSRALVDRSALRFKSSPFFRFHNLKQESGPFPLSWACCTKTVVYDPAPEALRIWLLICRSFLTVGILPGSWWAHHELGRGGWWFRDPVENASFMPRVLATARIHSVIFPLLHSWTLLLSLLTFLSSVLGTFSIRSGLLASVHSFATDETRGRFLWRFLLLMTALSILLFSQMIHEASVRRTYKKERFVAQSSLVHLGHLARAQPRRLKS